METGIFLNLGSQRRNWFFASKGKDNKAQRLYTNLFAWGPCSTICMNTGTDSVYRSKEKDCAYSKYN